MENDVGKHIKTKMDYDMIEQFAQEIQKLDPENALLKRFSEMDNFEGSELRKCLKR
jgi:predicted NACHT family NTPase